MEQGERERAVLRLKSFKLQEISITGLWFYNHCLPILHSFHPKRNYSGHRALHFSKRNLALIHAQPQQSLKLKTRNEQLVQEQT